jgi:hypothetical protein
MSAMEMTIPEAQRLLCLQHLAGPMEQTSYDVIYAAFRSRVREAATGTGGYREDMHDLVRAKDALIAAIQVAKAQAPQPPRQEQHTATEQRQQTEAMRRQEQARAEAMRRRAHEEEQREDELRHERERRARERQEREAQEAAMRLRNFEALRSWERTQARKREQARLLWSMQVSAQQAQARQRERERGMQQLEQQLDDPGTEVAQTPPSNGDPASSALRLFQQRRIELEQMRVREQELMTELTQLHRSQAILGEKISQARTLADQIRNLLQEGTMNNEY